MSAKAQVFISKTQGLNLTIAENFSGSQVGTFVKDGVTYVVTDTQQVFQAFPLIDLRSGTKHELWLTADQVRSCEHSSEDAPHERLWELPQIGLPGWRTLRDATERGRVEAYTHPACVHALVRDKGGHLWHGEADENTVRCFKAINRKARIFTYKFAMPYLRYIGPETDEVWLPEGRQPGKRQRVTLASYPVRKLIEEEGMWGYYYPTGDACSNVKLARKEMSRVRQHLMSTKMALLDSVQSEVRHLEVENTSLRKALDKSRASLQVTELQLNQLNALVDEHGLGTADRITALEQRAKDAEERARIAEETLAEARRENEGWDWSRF